MMTAHQTRQNDPPGTTTMSRRRVIATAAGIAAGFLGSDDMAAKRKNKNRKKQSQTPVFVVTDAAFGAAGDGTTPDTDAIQAAINAASAAKGTVLFPPGTYLLEKPLTLKSDITLAAQRRRTATLKCEPVGTPPAQTGFEMLRGVDASHVTIRGLVIASTGTESAAGSAIVCFTGPDSPLIEGMHTVSDLRVLDCEIHGFMKRGVRTAATRLPGQGQFRRVQVSDCHIHHLGLMDDPESFGLGIQPNGCDGVVITGNHLHDIGQIHLHWGVYASDSRAVTIANNRMQRCAGGIAIAGDTVIDEIRIERNIIEDATSDAHIGMQLIGGAHCLVADNRLKGAIIQAATGRSPRGKNSVIDRNSIDLDQLGLSERGAIFIGASGSPAVGLLVQGNRIHNGRHADVATADRGIRLKVGVDIAILDNAISQVFDGIFAFARTDLTPPDEPLQNLEISRNTISDTGPLGSTYISVANVQGLVMRGNVGRGGSPAFGFNIGGEDSGNVNMTKNRAGPGPTAGPLIVPAEWAGRPDIDIDPFVEISPGVWAQK